MNKNKQTMSFKSKILIGTIIFALILLTISFVSLGVWAGGSFNFISDSRRTVIMSMFLSAVVGTFLLTYFGPKMSSNEDSQSRPLITKKPLDYPPPPPAQKGSPKPLPSIPGTKLPRPISQGPGEYANLPIFPEGDPQDVSEFY